MSLMAQFFKQFKRRDALAWLTLIDSRNGFERQAAIEALARLRHASALRHLLGRANDWVPQVRNAAQRAILSFLHAAFVTDWAGALESLVKLQEARRTDHQALLEDIAKFLSQAETLPTVRAASQPASIKVRRYVFELEWRHALSEQTRFFLLQQALQGHDVMLARQAMLRLTDLDSLQCRQDLVQTACRSRFAAVRLSGLGQAQAQSLALPTELLRQMCQDSSPDVRANALALLRAKGAGQDAVSATLARLGSATATGQQQAIALHFLNLATPQTAVPLCQERLHARAALVRRVAYAVLLAQAKDERQQGLLLQALADSSAKVQNLALEKVRRGAAVPPSSEVFNIARGHGSTRAMMRVASILDYSATWSRLKYLLELLKYLPAHDGPAVWLQALSHWEVDARRNFVEPTVAQLQELGALWGQCAELVPEPLRGRMAFHLRTALPQRNGQLTSA